jgi:predicted ester cyclase
MVAELNAKQNEALEYFEAHLDEWAHDPLLKYKFAVIRENALVGAFDTFQAAAADAFRKYPEVDFIIQELIPDDEVVNFVYPALV